APAAGLARVRARRAVPPPTPARRGHRHPARRGSPLQRALPPRAVPLHHPLHIRSIAPRHHPPRRHRLPLAAPPALPPCYHPHRRFQPAAPPPATVAATSRGAARMAVRALPTTQRRPLLTGGRREALGVYLLVLPVCLVLLGLVAYPFVYAIVISFTSRVVGNPGRFVGLANYRFLFGWSSFNRAVTNTVVLVVVSD